MARVRTANEPMVEAAKAENGLSYLHPEEAHPFRSLSLSLGIRRIDIEAEFSRYMRND